jgi:hypothetical protein
MGASFSWGGFVVFRPRVGGLTGLGRWIAFHDALWWGKEAQLKPQPRVLGPAEVQIPDSLQKPQVHTSVGCIHSETTNMPGSERKAGTRGAA